MKKSVQVTIEKDKCELCGLHTQVAYARDRFGVTRVRAVCISCLHELGRRIVNQVEGSK